MTRTKIGGDPQPQIESWTFVSEMPSVVSEIFLDEIIIHISSFECAWSCRGDLHGDPGLEDHVDLRNESFQISRWAGHPSPALRPFTALCTVTMRGSAGLLEEIPRALVWTLDSCFATLGCWCASKNKHAVLHGFLWFLSCIVDYVSKGSFFKIVFKKPR